MKNLPEKLRRISRSDPITNKSIDTLREAASAIDCLETELAIKAKMIEELKIRADSLLVSNNDYQQKYRNERLAADKANRRYNNLELRYNDIWNAHLEFSKKLQQVM